MFLTVYNTVCPCVCRSVGRSVFPNFLKGRGKLHSNAPTGALVYLMASAIRMDMSTVLILLVKSLWFSRGTVLVTITSSISEACAQPEDEQVLQREASIYMYEQRIDLTNAPRNDNRYQASKQKWSAKVIPTKDAA